MNKHVKRENSQKAKRGQKRAFTQLGKNMHQIYLQKKGTKEEINKLTLPIPPNLPWNEINNTSGTLLSNAGPHNTHTLTQKQNKTKQKLNIKKQAKFQKSKSEVCENINI